ncbi:MATE family efflux transporter [Oceanotoga sp. DSM 15011]|uniref:MATE family efflux transporter n=1 Tax=Oceanotoga sp. DSM 15011 TaxID=2984951 RepID=UPI0021F4B034|nr:MATE family efflux transporter [Oceanotoga sp. DSM 15011]UYO99276.1 MATE family efflux transporter [Oceanotoga sp. DSM 15011]
MDYEKKRDMILHGDIKKALLKMAIPLLLSNLSQTLYNLTDTYWVGKIGSLEVAAASFVWPVLFFVITIGIGISSAGTSLMSQYNGLRDKDNARLIAGQIFSLTIVFSIVMTIIGIVVSPYVLRWMGATGELYDKSLTYLRIMFLSTPVSYTYMVFNSVKTSEGNTLTPMIISSLGVVLNMILDPLFIINFRMGIIGAAIASVISQGVFLILIYPLLFRKKDGIYIKKCNLKLRMDKVIKIFKIGLPSTIGTSMESLGFIILNSFIVTYGNTTLAAYSVANRINSMVFMPGMAIGGAIVSIIGQNIGADQIDRVKKAFKTAALYSFTISMTLGIILFIYAENALKIFLPLEQDLPTVLEGTEYMKLMALSLFLVGMNDLLNGTFQGSGHTLYSMMISMGRLWIFRIPMIIIFQNFTDLGSTGVWYAMVLSNFLTTIMGFLFFFFGKWERRVVEKSPVYDQD